MEAIVPSYTIVLTTIIRKPSHKAACTGMLLITIIIGIMPIVMYDHMHNCPIITVRLCASRRNVTIYSTYAKLLLAIIFLSLACDYFSFSYDVWHARPIVGLLRSFHNYLFNDELN